MSQIVYYWVCGHELISPVSIRKGVGPVCAQKLREKYPHITDLFNLDGHLNI